jgi:8-oxo-dGTP diphosphatase
MSSRAKSNTAQYPDRPLIGVIVVVLKDDEVLLVQRAKEPHQGWWGLPGGAVELGESLFNAAIREVKEETGVTIAPFAVVDIKEVIQYDAKKRVEYHYCPIIIGAEWVKGKVKAGSDAAAARWVAIEEIGALSSFPDTAKIVQKTQLQRTL